MSVQKQTRSGQRTRQKAVVVVGDQNGHVGVGVASGKDAPAAVKQATNNARRNIIPVRLGCWAEETAQSKTHTLPCKVTGKSGSVRVRVLPAPPGRSVVANKTLKVILDLAGIKDCFISSKGHTSTIQNHAQALINALSKTYLFYPQQDWNNNVTSRSLADQMTILKKPVEA
ncbi:MAG: 40S ribosomal protein [Paramarteilia canceri]